MNKYDRIKRASQYTKELEKIEVSIKKLVEGNLSSLSLEVKDSGFETLRLKSIMDEADIRSAEYLAMATDFYRHNIIMYYNMRKKDIIKEIDNLIED